MPAVLDEIVAATRDRVGKTRRSADLRALEKCAEKYAPRGFKRGLQEVYARTGVAVIAELKQASPSKGVIRANLEPASLARELQEAGAAALSVLTEPQFFQGSLENLRAASGAVELPCLRKDFIVDEFQLLEAKANCADAVLLIASVLKADGLRALYDRARVLGLDVLCEVHDEAELEAALAAGCDIIGVNSRDLRTFAVNLEVAAHLGKRIPADVLAVAESGIHGAEDIARLQASGYKAFLIGESLMKAPSPGEALRALLSEALAAGGDQVRQARNESVELAESLTRSKAETRNSKPFS